MRAERRTEQVKGRADIRNPIANRFVDGVFEGAAATRDAAHFRAKQTHAEDVRFLPRHIDFAHVDDAFQAEQGAGGGGSDAMLAGTRFGDDTPFAHSFGKQCLPQSVVDFMSPGVSEVFTLEVDLRAAEFVRSSGGHNSVASAGRHNGLAIRGIRCGSRGRSRHCEKRRSVHPKRA